MELTDLNLATCNVAAYRPEMGVPVRTTVGLIRNIKCESGSKLAPYGVFGKVPDSDWEGFTRLYLERINGLADAIDTQLLALAECHPGETLVLLCFEDVRKEPCHRTLAARWCEERYGIVVPELGPCREPLHAGPTPGAVVARDEPARLF